MTAVILTLAISVSLTACSGSGDSAQPETTAATEAASTDAPASGAVISADDAVFTYNGVSIALDSSIDDMIAALGEANDVSSQLSCHGEGEDKTYTYDGFVVNSYPRDGKDYVLEIVINSEGIATSKGIEIGASAADVIAAYGSDYKEIGVYYYYDAGDSKSLQFLIEDDTVTEIDYYYSV